MKSSSYNSNIENSIKDIIAEVLFIEKSEITGNMFNEIEGLDSLALSIILSRIEKNFAITFEQSYFMELQSISSLTQYISARQ